MNSIRSSTQHRPGHSHWVTWWLQHVLYCSFKTEQTKHQMLKQTTPLLYLDKRNKNKHFSRNLNNECVENQKMMLWRRQFNYSNWHKINKEAISLGWSTLCLMCGWGVRTPVKLIFRVSCWWCLCIVVVVCTQLIIRQDFSLWYSHNSVLCTCSWGSTEILVKYRNWNHG